MRQAIAAHKPILFTVFVLSLLFVPFVVLLAMHWTLFDLKFFQELFKIVLYGTLVILFVSVNALFLVYMERKVAARIQLRRGPLHVGPAGILQTLADAIKLLTKELVVPKEANKFLYVLAPALAFAPILSAFLVLPLGRNLILRDLNIGFLLIFSLTNIGFIGIFLAGWASNNKYALLGSMRAVAQNLSYEIPILLSTMTVAMFAGTLSTAAIVAQQKHQWFLWAHPLMPLAFTVFFISALAEANRAPFDIPEAESELVAGFHTEYSGMRFALFFLGEYTAIFVSSALAATLFLGGWQGPWLPGPLWLLLKTYFLVFIVMWARWTFPRLRSDQLMAFAWKVLIPFALMNLLVTAAWIMLQKHFA